MMNKQSKIIMSRSAAMSYLCSLPSNHKMSSFETSLLSFIPLNRNYYKTKVAVNYVTLFNNYITITLAIIGNFAV